MKRLVAMVVTAGAAMAAVAMPTKAELQKAQTMVNDVTAADVAALKAKSKTSAEVAAKHMELAGQAGSEAEKYLLLQGAFKLYAKAGDYDAAANVIEKLQAEISDYDPEVTVELCGAEFIRKMRENAPRLYAPSMAILEGYCAELSDSLKSALPPGYVVRVPSIAEWEYAYHAGSDDPDDQPFGTLLRSYWGVFKHGAESPKNRWGLCEFHDVEKVLDRIDRKDLQPFGKEGKRVARLPPSNEREDLFYWTSDLTAAPYLSRWPVGERLWMESAHDHLAPVRLVIGPDLVSEWKAKHKK